MRQQRRSKKSTSTVNPMRMIRQALAIPFKAKEAYVSGLWCRRYEQRQQQDNVDAPTGSGRQHHVNTVIARYRSYFTNTGRSTRILTDDNKRVDKQEHCTWAEGAGVAY
eukprot:jgi/Psemu1/53771/gm1.53771_g